MPMLSMKCPRCGQADLVVTDRQEIEIDVCPACRGVWLDRGELDKLIQRSLQPVAPARTASADWDDDDDDRDDRGDRRWRGDDDHRRDHEHRRRRHSWLSDLFD